MATKIKSYDLSWNVRTNKGLVRMKLDDGKKIQFPIANLGEFSGWGALLDREPVYVTNNGWIQTGIEPLEPE